MSQMVNIAETVDLLKKHSKLVLACHVSPDGDTLGSGCSLAMALEQLGKNVTLVCDDKIPESLKFMPYIENIVKFSDEDIIEADLLVILDSSSGDRVGNVIECVKAPILNIDHHISNTEYADFLYLDTKAAATGEIIYALLEKLNVKIDVNMAIPMYTAIATDCGFFRFSNTTENTMVCASKLLKIGVSPEYISNQLGTRRKKDVVYVGKILPTMQFYENDSIATIEISLENYDEDIETHTLISYPRYIEGVDVAIQFKQVEPEFTRISMRSKYTDVSKVALQFGGGGHVRAAGCGVNKNLEDAKVLVINAVKKAQAEVGE